MEDYIYFIGLLVFIPIVYNILYCLRFESLFKQGKVWQIQMAYILSTIILSHFVACVIERLYLFSQSLI